MEQWHRTRQASRGGPDTKTNSRNHPDWPQGIQASAPVGICQAGLRPGSAGRDLLDGMELLYKEFGRSLPKAVAPLGPRDDVVKFDASVQSDELERNLRWHSCPEDLRAPILDMLKEYWDVFCEEGLCRNIRGFVFRVNTGDAKPICCRPPRYGPHESKVMETLVGKLEDNGLIEDNDGPWGAQVVLAAKPHQENVPWDQYQWRLCISY